MLIDFKKRIKKSFTLLEVLIVCWFFSIVILAIIWAITRAYDFMNNNRLQVRAVNFAREWVEMVFNIRDTNRRRHSGERDKYWNNVWTWDVKFIKGIYVLKEWNNSSEDVYVYASKLNVNDGDIEDFYWDGFWTKHDEARETSKIIFTWTYSYLSWVYSDWNWTYQPATWDMETLLWSEWDFYRLVRVYDVVDKLGGCTEDKCPKEMRFCVKIFYKNNTSRRSSELCSIMTNFE